MNLIIAGCEYSGTTTLANGIAEWARRTLGGRRRSTTTTRFPISRATASGLRQSL